MIFIKQAESSERNESFSFSENGQLNDLPSSHDDFLTSSEGMSNLNCVEATGVEGVTPDIVMHDTVSGNLQKKQVVNKQNQIHIQVSEIIDHEKRWVTHT